MLNQKNNQNLKGFSLFEIIITLGILMSLSLIVFPIASQKSQESKLKNYASQIATDIYYQQQRAKLKNIYTGINLENNRYTIFDGETLNSAIEKDTKTLPVNIYLYDISLSSPNDILFSEGNFKPNSYGHFKLTDGFFNIQVSINQEGLVEYESI